MVIRLKKQKHCSTQELEMGDCWIGLSLASSSGLILAARVGKHTDAFPIAVSNTTPKRKLIASSLIPTTGAAINDFCRLNNIRSDRQTHAYITCTHAHTHKNSHPPIHPLIPLSPYPPHTLLFSHIYCSPCCAWRCLYAPKARAAPTRTMA